MTIAREPARTKNPPWVWAVAALGVLILLGFAAWAFFATRPVTATAARRDIKAVIELPGEVVVPPGESAEVRSTFQAPVAKVYASVGQRVNKGDVLVELQFANAQAAYEAAQANVKAAETAYANAGAEYDQALREAREQLAAARAAEKQAAQPETSTTVSPDGSTIEVTSEPSGGELLAATQQRLAAERYIADVTAQKQVALAPFQVQLDQARQAFRDARSGRKMAMIHAPITGTVMALNAAPGQTVGEDKDVPVATIVDLSALQVQAGIPEDHATSLKAELPVTLLVDQLPTEKFSGRVDKITTTPGGFLKKGGLLAIVDFENTQGNVKPGMKARAQVDAGEVKNVLAVPVEAVNRDDKGRATVKIQRGGDWQDAIVETGLSDGAFIEIKSGLEEGAVIQAPQPLIDR